MKGFAPSIFDKLMVHPGEHLAQGALTRLSMDELKDTVARDLEAMLNTRTAISANTLKDYPECRQSIINYGLNDFAGLSLASTDDRAYICRCLEQAIARHEPRLQQAQAYLDVQDGATNRLNFAISALLIVHPAKEPVSFDALLQPTTLQYSISIGRRAQRSGG